MLPLGKHAQFELQRSRREPGDASFTSVDVNPRKYTEFREENSAKRLLNRCEMRKAHLPHRLVPSTKVPGHKL